MGTKEKEGWEQETEQKEWMGIVNNGRPKVGAQPLRIPNVKGQS